MQEFLKTVAFHYANMAKTESDETGLPVSFPLSRYIFCFPNRRCGLFFAKYLREAFGTTCLVPSIITIQELFGLFSQRQVPDRTTLLFRLYSIYRELSTRQDKEEFDQFVYWGDMLLSDFEDVDKYLVDADALFRNVKDLKDLEAEFAGFDPEIVAVIQSFWRNYRPVNCPEDAKREAFGQTWSILCDLYHTFRKELAQDNLAYEGMLEREVIDRLGAEELDLESILPTTIQKIVFVGLTAISKADRQLMLRLKLNSLAEFCWDYADARLKPSGTKATSAAYFTAQNLCDFPNALSEEELSFGLVPEAERQYTLYSVPSGVGQAQIASRLLKQWQEHVITNPLHTAVVLPDEKLLIPVLYSIPQELGTFNVTMGYGLKETPIAAFVELLASLNEGARHNDDINATFYYKPVLSLLSHNYVRALSPVEARDLTEQITKHNIYQVPASLFSQSDFLKLIFRPLHTATQAMQYLLEILAFIMKEAQEEIEQQAAEENEPSLFTVKQEETYTGADAPIAHFSITDHEFLYHYNHTLEQLNEEMHHFSFDFTPRTLFQLVQKLTAGVSVPFSGEPLQGIQVMGVLETRGMDFDNVIILSMNEGIFPAKPVNNTFVPMSLRNAFGMPTQRHRDAVFAYHFYRLISRARRVAMIYDSRTEGVQVGEESRYVKQLRYLMGHNDLTPTVIQSDISIPKPIQFKVEKTPKVMEQLQHYLAPHGKYYLSASAVIDYITCPLRFYLSKVEKLHEDDTVVEGVDNTHFGDILHTAICQLYQKAEGKRVEADLLRQYIEHPEGEITRQIQKGFEEVMGVKELTGYNLLVSRVLINYVVETLRHDMKRCPFVYIKGEYIQKLIYPVTDELQVRFKCIFDRIDRSVLNTDQLNIIDYKTGNSYKGAKLRFTMMEDLLSSPDRHEAFQVMLYCLMMHHIRKDDLQSLGIYPLPDKTVPNLYFVRDFHQNTDAQTKLIFGMGKEPSTVECFEEFFELFENEVRRLFIEIFDPSVAFTQCSDVRYCTYCNFKSICKR